MQVLRDHLTRGDYASLSVEDDFARRRTDDVRAVTHDLHFRIRYRAAGTPEVMSARAINPITHTNWEGTGVQPDVAVDPADAERVALALAAHAG